MDRLFTPEEHRTWTIQHDYTHEVTVGGSNWSELIGKFKDISCKRCHPIKKHDEQSQSWKEFFALRKSLKLMSYTQVTVYQVEKFYQKSTTSVSRSRRLARNILYSLRYQQYPTDWEPLLFWIFQRLRNDTQTIPRGSPRYLPDLTIKEKDALNRKRARELNNKHHFLIPVADSPDENQTDTAESSQNTSIVSRIFQTVTNVVTPKRSDTQIKSEVILKSIEEEPTERSTTPTEEPRAIPDYNTLLSASANT